MTLVDARSKLKRCVKYVNLFPCLELVYTLQLVLCVSYLAEPFLQVVELPMLHPEKFVKLGIDPPKGVLCYGPPGTGKTLLARAVANRTDACFIRVIGSELVQKYVGEGARMVRELFQVYLGLQVHKGSSSFSALGFYFINSLCDMNSSIVDGPLEESMHCIL